MSLSTKGVCEPKLGEPGVAPSGRILSVRKLACLAAFGAALFATGCTNPHMPVAGPESWDIRAHNQDPDSVPYALVKLNPEVMSVLGNNAPGLYGVFTDRRPPQEIKFGI